MPPIIYLPETESTNNHLKQLLATQQPAEGTVVYTDYQTQGRGQRGNEWESACGDNLLFSLILYPHQIKANEQFIISQLVSLAIKDCLEKLASDFSIKWSNDIYWRDRKICGILIENVLMNDGIENSIIGIGININQIHFRSNIPNPVSLRQILEHDCDREIITIMEEIRNNILYYYSEVCKGNKTEITKLYKNSLYRSKGYHLFDDGISVFSACIANVEPSGTLVLQTQSGDIRRFAFKEVKHVI